MAPVHRVADPDQAIDGLDAQVPEAGLAQDALEFARAFRREFGRYEIGCRAGIDAGPVLVFDLPGDEPER